jgi:hypothetical protein
MSNNNLPAPLTDGSSVVGSPPAVSHEAPPATPLPRLDGSQFHSSTSSPLRFMEVERAVSPTSQEYWTPERRAAHAQLTRERMAAPEVRHRVSARTRAAQAARRMSLEPLHALWRTLDRKERAQFLREVIGEFLIETVGGP